METPCSSSCSVSLSSTSSAISVPTPSVLPLNDSVGKDLSEILPTDSAHGSVPNRLAPAIEYPNSILVDSPVPLEASAPTIDLVAEDISSKFKSTKPIPVRNLKYNFIHQTLGRDPYGKKTRGSINKNMEVCWTHNPAFRPRDEPHDDKSMASVAPDRPLTHHDIW